MANVPFIMHNMQSIPALVKVVLVKGSKGDAGRGISSFTKISTSGLVDTWRMTYTDETYTDVPVTNGRSVVSITKTGTSENVDTYTISYNDNTTSTFTVTNGQDGEITGDVIADPYDNTKAYKIGILLSYQGKLYECIKDATAGTLPTNTTYFNEVSVAEKIGDLQTGLENGTIVPNKSRATESIENVSDESGTTQDNPFISQGTGTNNNVDSVDTSPVAKQIEKQGYTVANNQYVPDNARNYTNTTQTDTKTAFNFQMVAYQDTTIQQTLVNTTFDSTGYKAFTVQVPNGVSGNRLRLKHNGAVTDIDLIFNLPFPVVAGQYLNVRFVLKSNDPSTVGGLVVNGLAITILTQYFNGNSNIPQDLLDNPSHWSWYDNGTGSYDAGSLKNASGRYLVCTHRQLWDEQIRHGTYNSSGVYADNANYTCSI